MAARIGESAKSTVRLRQAPGRSRLKKNTSIQPALLQKADTTGVDLATSSAPAGCLLIILASLIPNLALGQGVVYVDRDATGASDGSSWRDAFVSLQDALAIAEPGGQVWIAEGEYRVDQGFGIAEGDRTALFEPTAGVSLLGGFSGTEADSSDRVLGPEATVLTGDLGENDPNGVVPDPAEAAFTDNAPRVLRLIGAEGFPSLLDRLTITGGVGTSQNDTAVLVQAPCILRNVSIVANAGFRAAFLSECDVDGLTAIRNRSAQRGSIGVSGPITISDAEFIGNVAEEGGGGLYIAAGPATVSRSAFVGNQAFNGGAILVNGSVTLISVRFISNQATCNGGAVAIGEFSAVSAHNSLFASNTAWADCSFSHGAGAISVAYASLDVANTTFVGNSARYPGDVISSTGGKVTLHNSILQGNGSITQHDLTFEMDTVLSDSTELAYVVHDEPNLGQVRPIGPVRFARVGFPAAIGRDGLPGTLDDDYTPNSHSAGLDWGSNGLIPSDVADLDSDGDIDEAIPLDLNGNPRILGAQVDVGAFETPAATGTDVHPQPASTCQFELYPNPTSDSVWLSGTAGRIGRISLYDSTGRRYGTWNGPSIDLSESPPGLYLIRIETISAQTVCTKTVLKQ
ncbi:MAG: T9SS type A sorting domain-containing protein [Rhodothermales bacterium]|nr:T9SS type A sorting domain-containing protein [Rhodothermales bacterium]MBO6778533.1 T9SS type A sorting domain-containing protein [Rhodothermales bacterium]